MGRLNAAQIEQLRVIGADLRQKRQQAGISLEEVSVKTYIPLRILQALEEANDSQLPEPVFVQGFIRRYGDLIGLDGTAISKTFSVQNESFKLETPSSSPTPATPQKPLGRPAPPKSTNGPKTSNASSYQSTARSIPQSQSTASQSSVYYILAGILGFGVLAGIAYLAVPSLLASLQPQPSKSPLSPVASTQQAPQLSLTSQSTAKPIPTPSVKNSALSGQGTQMSPAPIKGVQATISLTDSSWLQVDVDGKTEFEGVLPKGTKKTWQAKQAIVLSAGNAGGVTASFNNGKAAPLGKAGGVKTVNVSKSGVQVLEEL